MFKINAYDLQGNIIKADSCHTEAFANRLKANWLIRPNVARVEIKNEQGNEYLNSYKEQFPGGK